MKHRPIKNPIVHPVLGFGVMGWVSLPVLLAVIVMTATGYDLYSAVLSLIADLWGIDALDTVTIAYAHIAMSYRSITSGPSLVLLLVLLPVFWLSPRRRWRKLFFAFLFLNAFWFFVTLEMSRILTPRFPESNHIYWKNVYDVAMSTMTWVIALNLSLCFAAYMFTRSKVFLGILLLPIVLYWFPFWLKIGFKIQIWEPDVVSFTSTGVLEGIIWHAALFGVFLNQVIRERRNLKDSTNCWHCAYDLTAHNPANPCPECGNAIPEDHPLCTSPSPASQVSSVPSSPAS